MAHFGLLGALDWSDSEAVADFLVGTERLCAGTGAPFDAAREEMRVARVMTRASNLPSMFNHATRATREEWAGQYRKIGCPTLVIHGEDDPILPIATGEALAESIPGASLNALAGVGHEIPPRVIPAMAAQIATHVKGGAWDDLTCRGMPHRQCRRSEASRFCAPADRLCPSKVVNAKSAGRARAG